MPSDRGCMLHRFLNKAKVKALPFCLLILDPEHVSWAVVLRQASVPHEGIQPIAEEKIEPKAFFQIAR